MFSKKNWWRKINVEVLPDATADEIYRCVPFFSTHFLNAVIHKAVERSSAAVCTVSTWIGNRFADGVHSTSAQNSEQVCNTPSLPPSAVKEIHSGPTFTWCCFNWLARSVCEHCAAPGHHAQSAPTRCGDEMKHIQQSQGTARFLTLYSERNGVWK